MCILFLFLVAFFFFSIGGEFLFSTDGSTQLLKLAAANRRRLWPSAQVWSSCVVRFYPWHSGRFCLFQLACLFFLKRGGFFSFLFVWLRVLGVCVWEGSLWLRGLGVRITWKYIPFVPSAERQQKEKKKNSNKNLKWILSREICNWNSVSTTLCAAAVAANFLIWCSLPLAGRIWIFSSAYDNFFFFLPWIFSCLSSLSLEVNSNQAMTESFLAFHVGGFTVRVWRAFTGDILWERFLDICGKNNFPWWLSWHQSAAAHWLDLHVAGLW